ncbi:prohibitin-1, mitochondrial-like [Cynara cardunculus var. scolymus]|uniref:prohibitin-1, mitochondrial-like n=1 Tax=Cynara cardunculus var. scolymus TaxID=59895 RepID=UPI000D62EB24|nr:prohibitin-1, mitochondrial-like [Cynara cardunculus var. scolymus]
MAKIRLTKRVKAVIATRILACNTLYNDEGGQRAIIFTCLVGGEGQVYPKGTHIVIPWLERPIIYDVRARPHPHPHLVESTSGSRDLQMVSKRWFIDLEAVHLLKIISLGDNALEKKKKKKKVGQRVRGPEAQHDSNLSQLIILLFTSGDG